MSKLDIKFNIIDTLSIERIKQKLSTKELSKKANVELRTIQRIEAFEGDPKFSNIIKIADALGLELQLVKKERNEIEKKMGDLTVSELYKLFNVDIKLVEDK